jgi:predicted DCC family thiol-disulfide oxidoreductase YuxK
MRISFWNLQACYVTFVDWHRVLGAIGRRLFPNDMYLIYDGNCKLCRRTVSSFRVFDLLGRVIYANALDSTAIKAHDLNWLDADAMMRDMHVVVGKKTSVGFAAYREWMKRMPVFWFIVPFMYLWPVQVAGKRTYRHIADSRTCAIGDSPLPHSPHTKSIFVVGGVGYLIVLMAVLSAIGKLQSWPIAAYPSFEDLDPPEVRVLTIATRNSEGEASELRPIERHTLKEMSSERLMALQYRLILSGDKDERTRQLAAFWDLWRREDPELRQHIAVRFYNDTISTLPHHRYRSPIRREVVAEPQFHRTESLTQITANPEGP